MTRIYVATSWRNERQPEVVAALRDAGHEVYDFKNPSSGNRGFHWSEIDGGWQDWTPATFRQALTDPIAAAGFESDMRALRACYALVLVLPSGRSSHLEAGWAVGAGKHTIVLLSGGEPELMYKMFDEICLSIPDVLEAVVLQGAPHA